MVIKRFLFTETPSEIRGTVQIVRSDVRKTFSRRSAATADIVACRCLKNVFFVGTAYITAASKGPTMDEHCLKCAYGTGSEQLPPLN